MPEPQQSLAPLKPHPSQAVPVQSKDPLQFSLLFRVLRHLEGGPFVPAFVEGVAIRANCVRLRRSCQAEGVIRPE